MLRIFYAFVAVSAFFDHVLLCPMLLFSWIKTTDLHCCNVSRASRDATSTEMNHDTLRTQKQGCNKEVLLTSQSSSVRFLTNLNSKRLYFCLCIKTRSDFSEIIIKLAWFFPILDVSNKQEVEFMELKRHIDKWLREWKNNPEHKPALIRGIRQSGKAFWRFRITWRIFFLHGRLRCQQSETDSIIQWCVQSIQEDFEQTKEDLPVS